MTYSIVARCARTGELGAAVASAVPAVGAICLYGHSGVGMVCTQSWANPYLAETALAALATGGGAEAALADAMATDAVASHRQVAVIGTAGPPAAFTGADCSAWAGQIVAEDHVVQGNMLTGAPVLGAMSPAFAAGPDLPLEERLMRALEAGQRAGGDRRGRQSAALIVRWAEFYPRVDLRVDEHPAPVVELRRVFSIAARQLAPFVAAMPRRGEEFAPAPGAVVELLMKSPPDRPGGGGTREP